MADGSLGLLTAGVGYDRLTQPVNFRHYPVSDQEGLSNKGLAQGGRDGDPVDRRVRPGGVRPRSLEG